MAATVASAHAGAYLVDARVERAALHTVSGRVASTGLPYHILIQLGIGLFLLAVIFQIITLPVEFDASRRALIELQSNNILPSNEDKSARKVLFAAAMTYVAAAASGVLQLLRLLLLFNGRGRRN